MKRRVLIKENGRLYDFFSRREYFGECIRDCHYNIKSNNLAEFLMKAKDLVCDGLKKYGADAVLTHYQYQNHKDNLTTSFSVKFYQRR